MCSLSYAGLTGTKATEKAYASVYADQLIEQFDAELDKRLSLDQSESILSTHLYSKILGVRSYIEDREDYEDKELSLINITNTKMYNQIVKDINSQAKQIKLERDEVIKSEGSVLFPSVTTSGNLTGNTYPSKVWSLTFDDGPRGSKTKTVVDNLYQRGVKATFYMLTSQVKQYPETAKYVVDSGMNIALHSYTHLDLNKQTASKVEYEITKAKNDLEAILGVKTTTFRLPYGSGMRNSKLRAVIARNKFIHIFWNIDTLDWKDKNPASIQARVEKQMKLTPKNSGIILYHDIHNQSVIASAMTMDYLLDNGHKICTVEEVIDFHNGKEIGCVK
jgi:peptidoglycan/xylan/chitin deacetylase (PgdA/CDA1 family)